MVNPSRPGDLLFAIDFNALVRSVIVNLDSQYSLSWSFNCVIFVDLRKGLFVALWESVMLLVYNLEWKDTTS